MAGDVGSQIAHFHAAEHGFLSGLLARGGILCVAARLSDFLRLFRDLNAERLSLVIPQHLHLRGLAHGGLRDHVAQHRRTIDRSTVVTDDDVARLDARRRGRTVRDDFADERALRFG